MAFFHEDGIYIDNNKKILDCNCTNNPVANLVKLNYINPIVISVEGILRLN